ncbi:MAG: TIGR04053 family radical SAM/SPASM domain-containing protein [Proteobacteria bacterium]|nr:TIGR04053 family radical SAM/SPASM domain-containing protein [Pseudomonadota bacterium]
MSRRPHVPDFAVAPFLVIWETTRACALACAHCRAEAIDQRHSEELSTSEGKALLRQVHEMGTPICVLTGGDPLQRADLEELIEEGTRLGMRMATIPAATPRLTRERLTSLRDAGVAQIAFSLDASEAEAHDDFRGVPGSFDRTIEAARIVTELGVPLQINTVLGPWNQHDVFEMAELVEELGVSFWEVFVLVPVGRGETAGQLRGAMVEHLFEQLHDVARKVDFVLKVAEAPHYRRFVMMREFEDEADARGVRINVKRLLERPTGPRASIGHAPRSVNAGRGFCFVDHRGEVMPSGFLPISAGNVRSTPLAELYRHSDLFRMLRDPSKLKGRCGQCEFSALCGGSRSRAFAVTGDPLAEDPWCAYKPGTADPALVALTQRPAPADVGHGGRPSIGHAGGGSTS